VRHLKKGEQGLRLLIFKLGPEQLLVTPTGPARPGHAKIALDITAVEFDQFYLYSTGTMIMYDRVSL